MTLPVLSMTHLPFRPSPGLDPRALSALRRCLPRLPSQKLPTGSAEVPPCCSPEVPPCCCRLTMSAYRLQCSSTVPAWANSSSSVESYFKHDFLRDLFLISLLTPFSFSLSVLQRSPFLTYSHITIWILLYISLSTFSLESMLRGSYSSLGLQHLAFSRHSFFLLLVTQLCPTLCDPWTVVRQVPLSGGFSRQEYWSGLPCPSPGDRPNARIKPGSPALHVDSLPSEPQTKPHPFLINDF